MMLNGAELLRRLKQHFPGARSRADFPFLRIRVASDAFEGKDDEAREETVIDRLQLPVGQLREATERLFIRLELVTAAENEEPSPPARGATWMAAFGDEPLPATLSAEGPSTVHCYGYKGGQGRTTFLCILAQALARDGYRVLVVDLDAEAPTLDLVLSIDEIHPEASIVGLRAGLALVPVPFLAPPGNGSAALVAFRPSSKDFDLDAAALVFEAGVYSPGHENLAARLRASVAGKYDVVLMDHRTGLGPTVPAWMRAMPGPIVVFDRLDGQSRRAVRDVGRIWSGLSNPGLLVSLALHAPTIQQFRHETRGDAWPWLEALATAKSAGAEAVLSAEDIADDHWQVILDDSAFRGSGIPQWGELNENTKRAVSSARMVLGLAGSIHRAALAGTIHPSGAQDQGSFIVTDALRKLKQPASPIRFVFGRKGTGKTRLVHELARLNVADPLVVADDEEIGGLRSSNAVFQDLLNASLGRGNPERFWWGVIDAALAAGPNPSRLEAALAHGGARTALQVREAATAGKPHVFLVDGLETMAHKEKVKEAVGALLRVHATIEGDPTLRGRLSLRIFLRSDIAQWGFENLEQLAHGRRLDLAWSTQAIFNFVLSRLPLLKRTTELFPDVVEEVRGLRDSIEEATVPTETCLKLMLRIFPERLGRLNMFTATFLKTYFSDDPSGEQSYYPRVYDKFLQVVDESFTGLVAGRVPEGAITRAHDTASEDFLTQVKTELSHLTRLPSKDLERFIGSLKGKGTPFDHRKLAYEIRNSLKLKKGDIDDTLQSMLELGIFEEHPAHAGLWRAGRLFKAALKMKYNRGQSG